MLGTVHGGLPRVPLEHSSVYTKLRREAGHPFTRGQAGSRPSSFRRPAWQMVHASAPSTQDHRRARAILRPTPPEYPSRTRVRSRSVQVPMTTGITAAVAAPLVFVAISRPRSRCSAASAGGSSRVVTVPAKGARRRRTGSASAPDPRPTRRASRLLRDLGASRQPNWALARAVWHHQSWWRGERVRGGCETSATGPRPWPAVRGRCGYIARCSPRRALPKNLAINQAAQQDRAAVDRLLATAD